jgi:hypothetical protein
MNIAEAQRQAQLNNRAIRRASWDKKVYMYYDAARTLLYMNGNPVKVTEELLASTDYELSDVAGYRGTATSKFSVCLHKVVGSTARVDVQAESLSKAIELVQQRLDARDLDISSLDFRVCRTDLAVKELRDDGHGNV